MLSNAADGQQISVLDFLMQKDIAKFKAYYSSIVHGATQQNISSVTEQIYGMPVGQLDRESREYLGSH